MKTLFGVLFTLVVLTIGYNASTYATPTTDATTNEYPIIVYTSDEAYESDWSAIDRDRTGELVVIKCYGICVNAETGDGYEVTTYGNDFVLTDSSGNDVSVHGYYINYSRVPDIQDGDGVITYLFMNPETWYTDDIVFRYDFIVEGGSEYG